MRQALLRDPTYKPALDAARAAALMRVIESPIDGELLTAANEEELRAAVRRHYQEHKPTPSPPTRRST